MGRLVDVEDLVTTARIAERFAVSRNAVHEWRQRLRGPPFPEPVLRVPCGTWDVFLWLWPEVEAWGRTSGRFPPATGVDEPKDPSPSA